jgi:hypothetical protein
MKVDAFITTTLKITTHPEPDAVWVTDEWELKKVRIVFAGAT